jgi:hypothetical protein
VADRTEMVADERELELAVAGYVAQGFMVVNRTGVRRSDDGGQWWDGTRWRPVPS